MKKSLLSIAIIATLPFTAMATDPVAPVGPSAVPTNGTAVIATASAPYVTVTPTAADESHIATTAYVKGAYNDTIAAVNKVNSDKQKKLVSSETGEDIDYRIISAGDALAAWDSDIYTEQMGDNKILSANAAYGISFLAANAVVQGYKTILYTEWDTDNIVSIDLVEE